MNGPERFHFSRLKEESEFVTKNLLAELGSQDDDPSKLDELRLVDHFITPFFELLLVLKKSNFNVAAPDRLSARDLQMIAIV
jgi:hypothetical protein